MEKQQFFEEYRKLFEKNGLSRYCDESIVDRMYRMVEHLLEVNAHTNLTAITDWNDILFKHLLDSCMVLPHIPEGARVLDVGCGGGFPSLPIAIARQDLRVTGLDSTGKKVDYVNGAASHLELRNLQAICARAEDLAKTDLRESFDVVTARAVAALPVLCELCIPFVKVGGLFCAMKGNPLSDEYPRGKTAFETLGAPINDANICRYSLQPLSGEAETRTIFLAKKQKKTPTQYPRGYGQIKKKPL